MHTRYLLTFLIAPACLLTANLGAAEAFDGSRPLLCATVETVECGPQADCKYGTADSLGFPQFLQIDPGKKRISATRPDGTALNAVVTTVTPLDDRLIMQGVENGLGWAISISRSTGRMAVAIAGDQIAFSVFGACTAK